jgi:hypothetical protein
VAARQRSSRPYLFAAVTATRLLYALCWLLIGLGPLFVANAIPPQTVPAAQAFWSAIEATGFMIPLLGATYVLGGLGCLWSRTTPLGLAILSPVLAVIACFNVLLAHQAGPWIAMVLVHAWLMWRYRTSFAALWSAA